MFFNANEKRQIRKLLKMSNGPQAQAAIRHLHLHFQPPTRRNPRATLWYYCVGDDPPTGEYLVAIRQELERVGSDVVRGQNAVRYGGQHGYIFTWLPNLPTDRR